MLIDPLFIYTSNDAVPPPLSQMTGGMLMVQAGYIRTSRYRHGMRSMMWQPLKEIIKKSMQTRWLENIILKSYLKYVLVVVNLLQGILILNTAPKAVETRTVLVQNENNSIEFQI